MAIEEHDREDLLKDGRTMPTRGQCSFGEVELMVGFRPQGQASLYCGADPVFQFNQDHELRRAFFRGQRFSADNQRLVRLARQSSGGKVQFVPHAIGSAVEAELFQEFADWHQKLLEQNSRSSWRVIESTPGEFLSRLHSWIELAMPMRIAHAPNA
ncbi:MAG: hypothetical protein AB8B91_18220 [Rubripirellula sp.]